METLKWKLERVILRLSVHDIIDEDMFDDSWRDIAIALLQFGIDGKHVKEMNTNIEKIPHYVKYGTYDFQTVKKTIFDELYKMFDSGDSFAPQKGDVLLFVGLPGSGKTTTCLKFAHYMQKEGWKPALFYADNRAGPSDQLKLSATEAKIPIYGCGADLRLLLDTIKSEKNNHDLIIVDSSGFSDFNDMREAINPNHVILVMDSNIGQSDFKQAEVLMEDRVIDAVILTKMDGNGNAKSGGILTAIAATKTPVPFIGIGEDIDKLKYFDVKQFVSSLLGKNEAFELLYNISTKDITFRTMHELFQNRVEMTPVGEVISLLLPGEKILDYIKSYIRVMESMTTAELDSDPELMDTSEFVRIGVKSGLPPSEVDRLSKKYKNFFHVFRHTEIDQSIKTSGLFRCITNVRGGRRT